MSSDLLEAVDRFEAAEGALREAQSRRHYALQQLVEQLVAAKQTFFLRPVNLGLLRRELRKKV